MILTLKLNRTATEINRFQRNLINENWESIESNYNQLVTNISNEASQKVIDEARLIWQEPVSNFSALATTYPSAEIGWASQTLDNGNVYRFYGNEGWKQVLRIDASSTNALDSKFTTITNKIISDDAISPDSFDGNDFQKVQQAIDIAISQRKAIKFTRNYNITGAGPLMIVRGDTRNVLQFNGIGGGIIKNDSGFMFSTSRSYIGDFLFNNMYFEGISGTGMVIFDADKIIRVRSNASIFRNVDTVAKATNLYLQSYDFVNDWFVGGQGSVFETPATYGLKCTNILVEHRENFFTQTSPQPTSQFNSLYNMTLKSCLIEGLSGYGFSGRNAEVLSIDDCYFEQNNGGNIIFNPNSYLFNVNISNSRCFENSATYTRTAFIVWAGVVGNVKSYNNRATNTNIHDTTAIVSGSSGRVVSENDGGSGNIDPDRRLLITSPFTSSYVDAATNTTVTNLGLFKRLSKTVTINLNANEYKTSYIPFNQNINLDDIISPQAATTGGIFPFHVANIQRLGSDNKQLIVNIKNEHNNPITVILVLSILKPYTTLNP